MGGKRVTAGPRNCALTIWGKFCLLAFASRSGTDGPAAQSGGRRGPTASRSPQPGARGQTRANGLRTACPAGVNRGRVAAQGPATPDDVIRTKRVPMAGRDAHAYSHARAQAHRQCFEQHARRSGRALTLLDPAPRVVLGPEFGLLAAGKTAAETAIVAKVSAPRSTSFPAPRRSGFGLRDDLGLVCDLTQEVSLRAPRAPAVASPAASTCRCSTPASFPRGATRPQRFSTAGGVSSGTTNPGRQVTPSLASS